MHLDDVYNNMHLPAGSTVLINTWGLSMDEEKWGPDVGEFKPERFAEYPLLAAEYANASDPEQRDHHAFGASVCCHVAA
jgi:cytochrome P450